MKDLLLQCANDVTDESISRWVELGYRFGEKGTHTSRTVMLKELSTLLDKCPANTPRHVYAEQIIEMNLLGKRTVSTRKLTNQRLGELYGLNPSIPIFRIMRFFWDADIRGRPLLALLTALSRDPLLRATASIIFSLEVGQEMVKTNMTAQLREYVGERLNDSILDKVVRNAASSWTQSGHLEGRVRKIRRNVVPTSFVVTYSLLLSFLIGLRGQALFKSPCVKVLDTLPEDLIFLAMDAKRLGIMDLKQSGGLLHISFDSLFNKEEKGACLWEKLKNLP